MKSLKKTMTKAASKAMAGVGMTSGVAAAPADARAGWEDFSDFSNAVPIGGGASLGARAVPLHDGLGAEMEPHPLTKDWAARIKNPKVRAAFAKRRRRRRPPPTGGPRSDRTRPFPTRVLAQRKRLQKTRLGTCAWRANSSWACTSRFGRAAACRVL